MKSTIAALICVMLVLCTHLASAQSSGARAAGPAGEGISGTWWIDNYAPTLATPGNTALPLTAAGKSRYQQNLQQLKSGALADTGISKCLPQGLPRTMFAPYPLKIIQHGNTITFVHEVNHTFWSVAMGAAHTATDEMDPAFMGESTGHWQKDTLVIDSVGFKARSFLDDTGLPHGEKLHVVTRLRRLSRTRLEVVATIEDPEFYSKPFSARRTFEARPDLSLMEYVCGEVHRDLANRRVNTVPAVAGSTAAGKQALAAAVHPEFSGIWSNSRIPGEGEYDGLDSRDLSFMMPWTAAEFSRHRDAIRSGNPLPNAGTLCLPAGMPNVMTSGHDLQIIQTPAEVWLLAESDHQVVPIYMDAEHPANLQPSWYGHSTGRWEGASLIVDTVGISDKSQIDSLGTPHSNELHLVVRLRLQNGGKRIEAEFTLEDPGAFKRPWVYTRHYDKTNDSALVEYACAENNEHYQ